MKITFLKYQKSFLLITFTCLLIIYSSCSEKKDVSEPHAERTEIAKIAVISDAHYFDPDLGTTGPDFETYITRDRKMLAESESILQSAVTSLISEDINIVLVSGDLTKDGEYSSHIKFANIINQLKSAGKKVYVVPGNHDINNFGALSYSATGSSRVPNITPSQFADIYKNFGYNEALYRDSNSLSYIVEPVEGLWIFGLDDCKYKENTPGRTSNGGAFSSETLNWIITKLKEAKSKNKAVIGFVHHNIIEHFNGEKSLLNEYVIDNWEQVSNSLADNGMNTIFTGHFHAQDIVKKQFNNSFLFDIETGSLVTYPVPYRLVKIYSDGTMTINSKRVTQISYNTNSKNFQEYAKDRLEQNAGSILTGILTDRLQFSQSEINEVLPLLVPAFTAYAAGDETPSTEIQAKTQNLMQSNNLKMQLVGSALNAVWNDLPPGDNNVEINIKTGEAKNLGKLSSLGKNTSY